jgi:hypothetical protein
MEEEACRAAMQYIFFTALFFKLSGHDGKGI